MLLLCCESLHYASHADPARAPPDPGRGSAGKRYNDEMRFIGLVVLLWGAIGGADVRAQEGSATPAQAEPPAPELTAASKAHYDAGRAYFAAGETKRAIDEFRSGQRDDDRPAFDYNLGVCYEKLGDAARAVAAFRRFAARASQQERTETNLEPRIAALEPRVGTVVVSAHPDDVQLVVDGEPTRLGDERMLRLTAGTHRFAASRDGYLAKQAEVVVTGGGSTTVDLTLELAGARTNRKLRKLALGLGIAGGIVVVGLAVGLGVGLTRPGSIAEGNVPAITVHP